MMSNFIYTQDKETANELRNLGLYEVQQSNESIYVFVNNGIRLPFNAEKNGCVYTNNLHF